MDYRDLYDLSELVAALLGALAGWLAGRRQRRGGKRSR